MLDIIGPAAEWKNAGPSLYEIARQTMAASAALAGINAVRLIQRRRAREAGRALPPSGNAALILFLLSLALWAGSWPSLFRAVQRDWPLVTLFGRWCARIAFILFLSGAAFVVRFWWVDRRVPASS